MHCRRPLILLLFALPALTGGCVNAIEDAPPAAVLPNEQIANAGPCWWMTSSQIADRMALVRISMDSGLPALSLVDLLSDDCEDDPESVGRPFFPDLLPRPILWLDCLSCSMAIVDEVLP